MIKEYFTLLSQNHKHLLSAQLSFLWVWGISPVLWFWRTLVSEPCGDMHVKTRLARLQDYKSFFFFTFLYFFFNFILFLNFTIFYYFCQISKWIRHRYTWMETHKDKRGFEQIGLLMNPEKLSWIHGKSLFLFLPRPDCSTSSKCCELPKCLNVLFTLDTVKLFSKMFIIILVSTSKHCSSFTTLDTDRQQNLKFFSIRRIWKKPHFYI